MSFGERIVESRNMKKISQRRLAELLGISPTRLNYWEKNKREPDVAMIKSLAQVLGTTGDYLIGNIDSSHEEKPAALSSNGINLILNELQSEYVDKYIELDEEGRDRVHNAIDYELAKQRERQKPETITLLEPSVPVCAGTGSYLDDDIEWKERTVLKNKYTYGASYIVELYDDSMEPEFHKGDRLIVTDARGQSPIYGRVGIFIINGNATFRQPLGDVLHPYNPECKDIVPTESDDVRYVGYVVGIIDDSWVIE